MSESRPVLVVEDDPALREALTDTLEIAGYNVISTGNAEQALVWLDKNKPDSTPGLVLTDVQMPGMDGHALLRTRTQCRRQLNGGRLCCRGHGNGGGGDGRRG